MCFTQCELHPPRNHQSPSPPRVTLVASPSYNHSLDYKKILSTRSLSLSQPLLPSSQQRDTFYNAPINSMLSYALPLLSKTPKPTPSINRYNSTQIQPKLSQKWCWVTTSLFMRFPRHNDEGM